LLLLLLLLLNLALFGAICRHLEQSDANWRRVEASGAIPSYLEPSEAID